MEQKKRGERNAEGWDEGNCPLKKPFSNHHSN